MLSQKNSIPTNKILGKTKIRLYDRFTFCIFLYEQIHIQYNSSLEIIFLSDHSL